MRTTLLACLLVAATAAGQSPLTTTFASSTFLASTGGVTVYFDLDVSTAVDINQIDANFYGGAGPLVYIEVWTFNGSHIGNTSSAIGWTQVGVSNTVVSAGRDNPTPCTFPTPFRLTPGVTGVAVQHFGAGAAYTAGTGTGLPYASTNEMTLLQGGSSNPPIFSGTQYAPRVMNCSIYYTSVPGFAAAATVGSGCGGTAEYSSYYENFPLQTFDLGGTATTYNSILHTYTGTGYVVSPGSGQWFTPVATTTVSDGTVSAAQALGFSFPLAVGSSTTDVWICDDGYLWLESAGIADFTPAVNEFLGQGFRMAPCWMSLTPASNIYFDLDPNGNAAYITWLDVAETGNLGSTISMQVALLASGDFEYRYGVETLTTLGNTFALVGVSPGGNALDPSNRDISATLPIILSPDLVTPSLELTSSNRPVLGTSWNLSVDNIPPTTVFGITLWSSSDPAIADLAALGLPGCQLRSNLDVVVGPWTPTGTNYAFALSVPPTPPSLVGVDVFTQAATFAAPPVNAFGAITSNGMKGTLGSQ